MVAAQPNGMLKGPEVLVSGPTSGSCAAPKRYRFLSSPDDPDPPDDPQTSNIPVSRCGMRVCSSVKRQASEMDTDIVGRNLNVVFHALLYVPHPHHSAQWPVSSMCCRTARSDKNSRPHISQSYLSDQWPVSFMCCSTARSEKNSRAQVSH